MIKTKSIYKPSEKEDGHRILITRYYPRGVKKEHFDEWLRELAPSRELLKEYKQGQINQEEFTNEFLTELTLNNESQDVIQNLTKTAKNENVTLLCYEKDGEFCHRHLVQSIIMKELGYESNQFLPIS